MKLKLFVYPVSASSPVVNYSPFCTKTEVYLRMLNVNYQREFFFGNPAKTPKGKLPYVEIDGKVVADSHFIEDELRNNHNIDLDKNFDDEQRAVIFSMKKMVEEYLYWCTVHNRWVNKANSSKTKSIFFGKIPWPMREIIWKVSVSKVKGNLLGHGVGRHSDQEILDLADKCLKSLSDFLGEKLYFMGDSYSSLDASAYGLLENIFLSKCNPQLEELALKYENLRIYTKNLNDFFTKLKKM